MVSVWFCAFSRCVGTFIFPLQLATDLLHPSADDERRKHKLKRLVQSPNSYFMDVKCPGVCNCVEISLVCDGALALLVCYDVSHICKRTLWPHNREGAPMWPHTSGNAYYWRPVFKVDVSRSTTSCCRVVVHNFSQSRFVWSFGTTTNDLSTDN